MTYKEVVQFLTDNKEWLALVLTTASLFVTIMLWLLGQIISLVSFILKLKTDKERYAAYGELEGRKNQTIKTIKYEPLFFDEPSHKHFLFYRGIKLLNGGKRTISKRKLLKNSYIVYGKAGDGKSAFLKYDFLKSSKKHLWNRKTYYLFLSSNDTINFLNEPESITGFLNSINLALYKKLYLYIDGIDEIGEQLAGELDTLFVAFKNSCKGKVKVKITCRNEFFGKFLERNNNLSSIKYHALINDWTSKSLLKYGKHLLLVLYALKYESDYSLSGIYKTMVCYKEWSKYITSPLLMKLYIYCRLHTAENIDDRIDNKYNLYEGFISAIMKAYLRRKKAPLNESIINAFQNNIAKVVFEMYKNNEKSINMTDCFGCIDVVLKELPNDTYTFTHETFFEYFIARNYLTNLLNNDGKIDLRIFSCSYSNDYADFITEAINKFGDKEKEKISNKLMELYSFSFSDNVKNEYKNSFGESNESILIDALDEKEKFSYKYEIIFRLGRLYISNEKIGSFLKLVYYSDSNIYLDTDLDYFIAILKRCCAISSSFIGHEEIELNYVYNMLPEICKNYNKNYDLANRSHTLLFYGDVKNRSIFDFKDDDICEACDLAFEKRIKRLQLDLPSDIKLMNQKQLKKYYFRLFDLATIYTFMYNRKRLLTAEELHIVERSRTSFEGSSKERVELMNLIKQKIINLQERLRQPD